MKSDKRSNQPTWRGSSCTVSEQVLGGGLCWSGSDMILTAETFSSWPLIFL